MKLTYRIYLFFALSGALLAFWLSPLTSQPAHASTAGITVIDDFEDGDVSDWSHFGGTNAGGGSAAASDRPFEGSNYFTTGWGGQGTASGFYGGAWKTIPDTSQIIPPATPWLNVWVFNESNTTVDQYTLEITIREDLDGNGWTNGSEDSFRLDTVFTSSAFNDQWTLVSAPVSSFINLNTGGDGTFNGNLDEVVIVIAGVQGNANTAVEVDFDQFSFTSGGPIVNSVMVFSDMEYGLVHGAAPNNGWFSFNGVPGSGGGISINTAVLPPSDGGTSSLETGWGGPGPVNWYGGFGRTNLIDLTGANYFNFWIDPDAGQSYTLEINLQEDDNNNGAFATGDDDEYRYNCVVSPTGPCAISGGGWQLISIPISNTSTLNGFYDNNAGGNGVFDAISPACGGNGELVNIVISVIGDGNPANFRTDYWNFSIDRPAILEVALDTATASVTEGNSTTITASLSMTHTQPITVNYTTADGTAIAGADYTAATGQLVFPPNTLSQSFTVATINDSNAESNENFTVAITNPVGVQLGNPSQAIITIADDDSTAVLSKANVFDAFQGSSLFTGTDPNVTDQNGNGVGIGFVTWSDGSSVAIAATTNTAEGIPAVPDQSGPSNILKLDSTIASWGGFSHAFNDGTNWVSTNWITYTGINFWLYGTGSGTTLFVDIMDNRNPGSTTDDAERWSYSFPDNVAGWHPVEIPFSSFTRKSINNGAPNDGLQLTQVWGWALGSLTSGGPETRYIDDVGLMLYTDIVDDFEGNSLTSGTDANGVGIGYIAWSGNGASSSIASTTAPPAVLPGTTMTNTVLQLDLNVSGGQWAGYSHAFTDASTTTWTPEDWSDYEGVCFWLYGNNSGGTIYLDIMDNRNPGSTVDDAGRWSVDIPDTFSGWQFFQFPFSSFNPKSIGNNAPNDGFDLTDIHGYAIGGDPSNANIVNQTYYIDELRLYGDAPPIGGLQVAFTNATVNVTEGNNATIEVSLNTTPTVPVTVNYDSVESTALVNRDYTAVSGQLTFAPGETTKSFTLPTMDDIKVEQVERVAIVLRNPISATFAFQKRMMVNILDNDTADPQMVTDIEGSQGYEATGNVTLSVKEAQLGAADALPVQGDYEGLLQVDYTANSGPNSFDVQFPVTEDWSAYQGLSFWYQGSNSGQTISVELQDNQAATTANVAPANWVLA